MANIRTRIKPPYPTLGEVCRLLAAAFDTKSTDPEIRKRLDRLAREGDFDWSLPPQIIEALLLKPLRGSDPDLSDFVRAFSEHLLREHIELLSHVSLDGLSRDEAAPLLVMHVYATHAASFLVALHDRFGGPDLGDFLRQGANPVNVVFEWAETSLDLPVAKQSFPENKQKRDDIRRWRRGDTIPGFHSSILPLQRELKKQNSNRASQIALFGKWMVVARAFAWLDRECSRAQFGALIPLVRREVLLNCPTRDVGRELSIANFEAGDRLCKVAECGVLLVNRILKRTEPKQSGDRMEARAEIDRFKALLDEHDADGRARYMLDWCEGRWCVLSGEEDVALGHYEQAADQALYRAGSNQRLILEEAISLAACLGKKAAVKRLKHRSLAMGLFSGHFSEFPEEVDVVSDWEIAQLAQAFSQLFPVQARFPEAAAPTRSLPSLPFRMIDEGAAETLQPDLINPNRVISIPTLDGRKYRRPQLIWFASQDRDDYVQQLLDAGADLNISDNTGGSALLSAIQCAEGGWGSQVLDLLLKRPHEKETLDRLTKRKRLSPLYQAVLLGDPEVVVRLLEMGASPDLAAGYPPQTPLYLCIERFAFYRPGFVKQQLVRRYLQPSLEDKEIFRRVSGGWAGAMGDRNNLIGMGDPRKAEIVDRLLDHTVAEAAEVPRHHLLRIAEVLLEHGADPNKKHSSPGPGRTPLMLAAEIDAADVFQCMVKAGGDPSLKDDQGNDCPAIAHSFGSHEVLKTLRY
ncbi:MAG: ankyrin repeat domain-containing protein [Rhodospirillales bacterium]